MWAPYLHHITVHFPIVMSLALAAVGIWYLRAGHAPLLVAVRFAGAATLVITSVSVVAGFLSAEPYWTTDGPDVLIHHRNLGLLVWVVMATGVGAMEWGLKNDDDRVTRFGVVVWIAVAFAAIGAGHWGGSGVHSDIIPWQSNEPVLSKPATP